MTENAIFFFISCKPHVTGASSAVVSAPASVREVLGSNPASSPTHEACLCLCQFGSLNEAKPFFVNLM
jgi:hypothetical protein